MALTRRLLEGLGIEGKHVETIIEAHTETVNGLKDEAKRYRERAEMVPDLQKQLEQASGGEDWKQKYEDERKAFSDYKAKAAQDAEAAKVKAAYRKLLSDEKISDRRLTRKRDTLICNDIFSFSSYKCAVYALHGK